MKKEYKKNDRGKTIYNSANISKMSFCEYIKNYPFCLNPKWDFKKRFEDMLISLLFLLILILFPITYPIVIIRKVQRDRKYSKREMENAPREH